MNREEAIAAVLKRKNEIAAQQAAAATPEAKRKRKLEAMQNVARARAEQPADMQPPLREWEKDLNVPASEGQPTAAEKALMLLNEGAQGATFNIADEASSGAHALWRKLGPEHRKPFLDMYDEEKAKQLADQAAGYEAMPGAMTLANVAGGAVPTLMGGAAAVGQKLGIEGAKRLAPAIATQALPKSVLGYVARGAKQAILPSALASFGAAEGTPEEILSQTAWGTLKGAGVGASLGGVAGVGAKLQGNATVLPQREPKPSEPIGAKADRLLEKTKGKLWRAAEKVKYVGAPMEMVRTGLEARKELARLLGEQPETPAAPALPANTRLVDVPEDMLPAPALTGPVRNPSKPPIASPDDLMRTSTSDQPYTLTTEKPKGVRFTEPEEALKPSVKPDGAAEKPSVVRGVKMTSPVEDTNAKIVEFSTKHSKVLPDIYAKAERRMREVYAGSPDLAKSETELLKKVSADWSEVAKRADAMMAENIPPDLIAQAIAVRRSGELGHIGDMMKSLGTESYDGYVKEMLVDFVDGKIGRPGYERSLQRFGEAIGQNKGDVETALKNLASRGEIDASDIPPSIAKSKVKKGTSSIPLVKEGDMAVSAGSSEAGSPGTTKGVYAKEYERLFEGMPSLTPEKGAEALAAARIPQQGFVIREGDPQYRWGVTADQARRIVAMRMGEKIGDGYIGLQPQQIAKALSTRERPMPLSVVKRVLAKVSSTGKVKRSTVEPKPPVTSPDDILNKK